MTDSLARFKRAVVAKRRADAEYRAALLAAAEEHGFGAVASVAGVSRQAVRQLVRRG